MTRTPAYPCSTLTRAALSALALTMAGAAAADPLAELFRLPVQSVRDPSFNRIEQRVPRAGSSAAAIANSVAIQQGGNGNTLILNLSQSNSGAVSANALNGRIDLD